LAVKIRIMNGTTLAGMATSRQFNYYNSVFDTKSYYNKECIILGYPCIILLYQTIINHFCDNRTSYFRYCMSLATVNLDLKYGREHA
jgi:hypothetical protein